ncbi:hypothetical protein H2200_013039 [Cladophialophora chaetospira]|uniref:Heterokaryon incompatibility domain-containing protein n=1 Tax=Cladophialophora chaetospira TaxID=386627 RepID=A0AA39CBS7_9EURO|nr:hypothetical protein H2200_013039 [Cladophialophora chaetospira]
MSSGVKFVESNFATPENDAFYTAGIYKPLNPARKEIRLVRILPGGRGDNLICELVQNVPLDIQQNLEASHEESETGPSDTQQPSGSRYYALSYVAGSPHETSPVQLEGRPFNLFRNLDVAMRRIRRTDVTTQVFIDQMCIDQSNVVERGQQVAIMGDVYKGCDTCLAWLGPDDLKQENMVLEALQRVAHGTGEDLDLDEFGARFYGEWNMIVGNQQGETADIPWILQNDPDVDLQFAGMIRFFSKDWFSRYWCFQEMILAPQAVFLYGDGEILRQTAAMAKRILIIWMALLLGKAYKMTAIDPFPVAGDEDGRQVSEAQLLRRSDIITGVRSSDSFFSLLNLFLSTDHVGVDLASALNNSVRAMSTDPRDRFYSMLGLLSDSSTLLPSYSNTNTIEAVTMEVFQQILAQQGWLDVLTWPSTTIAEDVIMQNRPSWLPDFRLPMRDELRYLGSRCADYKCQLPIESTQPPGVLDSISHARVIPEDDGHGPALEVCAILCNNVALENTVGQLGSEHESEDQTLAQWRACMNTAGIADIYELTEEPAVDALEMCISWGYKAYHGHAKTHLSCHESEDDAVPGQSEFVQQGIRALVLRFDRDRFFVTPDKFIGVGPAALRFDDTIAVLLDCNYPFIIRKIHGHAYPEAYSLTGPAYIYGLDVGLMLEEAHPIEESSDVTRIRLY